MAKISKNKVVSHLKQLNGATTAVQGKALEDLICYLFEKVPGIEIVARNELNAFQTEELDVAVWNNKSKGALDFLPSLFMVEAKNWSQPVGSQEVAYFATRLKHRGCDHGILVATNGITGVPDQITAAQYQIS